MAGPVLEIRPLETTDMLNIKPRYLVDGAGRKTGAVLSMKDYRALMQRLEDLEDSLELDRAVETATAFRAMRRSDDGLRVCL